jgi:transposase-like protein
LPWPAIASIAPGFEVSAQTLRKWPLLLQSSHRDDAALVCARDDHAATPPESRARLAVALALTPGGS